MRKRRNHVKARIALEAVKDERTVSELAAEYSVPGIMNTDQGSQFTSFAWTDRLRRVGTRISMD